MAAAAMLGLWAILLLAPATPIGRALRGWMVVRPAAGLNRVTRGHVLFVLLLASGAALAGWAIGHEAVRLMAMGLPELASWAAAVEVTAYLDALAAIVVAASAARIGAVRAILPSRRRRVPRPGRASRARRTPTPRPPANDADADGSAARAA